MNLNNTILDDDPVNVAVCFDRNMALPFLVLAESLRTSIKDKCRKLTIHALYIDELPDIVFRLRDTNTDRFRVNFIDVSNRFDNLLMQGRFTRATHIRFILHEILIDLKRVIYIDADTIAVGDISKLYDTDIKGHALGAVRDVGTTLICASFGPRMDLKRGMTRTNGIDIFKYIRDTVRLKEGSEHLYFNAGILLMDLDIWRKDDIAGAAMNFLSRNTNCVYLDQDALNHVMEGKYLQLDERWNSIAINTDDYCLSNGTEESMEIARKWRLDPWIVHFAGPKPWRADQDKTPNGSLFLGRCAQDRGL